MSGKMSSKMSSNRDQSPELANQILDLVLEIGNLVTAKTIHYIHLERINQFLEKSLPIKFILPAFPAKSPNPKKTLGVLPDYGEVLGLRRLNELCEKIRNVYSNGAEIVICSDGRVFSDLVLVEDSVVNAYTASIRKIIQDNNLTNLSTFCLEDVFGESTDYGAMRVWLTERFAASIDVLREKIKVEDEARGMFNGIHRFLFEDQLALFPDQTKTKLRERAKTLSYGVIQRSNAWSVLVEKQFPEAIRLSIHPQMVGSKKLPIRLLESDDVWRTPWHSAPLFDGEKYVLVARSEAEGLGAELISVDDKYLCYVLSARNIIAGAQYA